MTDDSIHLKSLKFSDPDEGPTRVVASFPADLLYSLAVLHGAIPPIVLTPDANEHSGEFYSFVSGRIANKYFDNGLQEAVHRYDVFSGAVQLAYHPTGSKDPDAPQQQLAGNLFMAISDHLGASPSAETNAERREIAEVLAQTVINYGWRQVTPIGRNA